VVKALLLVLGLVVAQQEIAVQLEAVAVALLAIADHQATVDRLAHQATVDLEVALGAVMVATTWVVLLECQSFYKAWLQDKTPLAVTQQDQTTHIARLNLASMSSRNQQYRSMEEGCSI
jgi:hypothetical protein